MAWSDRMGLVRSGLMPGVLAVAVGTWMLAGALRADEPATQPAATTQESAATQPALAMEPAPSTEPSTQPSTQPVVTSAAAALLAQIRSGYSGIKTLVLEGTQNGHFDVDGHQEEQHSDFTSTYQSPNKFQLESKDKTGGTLAIGSTGEKVYLYDAASHRYKLFDAKPKLTLDDLDPQVASAIRHEDLSLALAMTLDAGTDLIDGASTVDVAPDTTIDAVACPTLRIGTEMGDILVSFDPATHLLRRQSQDFTKFMHMRGAQVVKQAAIVADFKVKADAKVTDDQFAWAPPAGATEFHEQKEPSSLEGAAAPAFELKGMDDKAVKSDDLKGSVYVLDFWATWCGPCRAALPKLDEIYQSKKADGLKVFAVNLQEDKDTAAKFVAATHLAIPVLLDTDAKVAESYEASAIPETVLVGKDGKVRKVFVGGGQDKEILAAVEAALAEK